MTRINVVPPSELHVKHLVAEYREIVRVFALVRARVEKGQTPGCVSMPDKYTLGSGHVTFFFNKLGFVLARYICLTEEMLSRGYNPKPIPLENLLVGISTDWFGIYTPTEEALLINRERIVLRYPK